MRILTGRQLGMMLFVFAVVLTERGETAKLPLSAGMGPDRVLPSPEKTIVPTLEIAPAKGWPDGTTPTAAPGTRPAVFASGLDHPRLVYALPNGDVLFAETNSPPRPDDHEGVKGNGRDGWAWRSDKRALLVADDVGNVVWRVT